MPLPQPPPQIGLNSKSIRNSQLSPARLQALEHQGVEPLFVDFNIVAREGQFSDTTIANYTPRGNSSIAKFLLNEVSKRMPIFLKGEITTQFEGNTPKSIAFDIIYRADGDLPPVEILDRVRILQSFCYPRAFIGLNPPLCVLKILHLYELEVYVQQVLVNWHNQWNLNHLANEGGDESYGVPMGCDISVTCMMHMHPTREEVLAGATFNSTPFLNTGYSLSPDKDGELVLDHSNPAVQRILARQRAYVKGDIANAQLQQADKNANAANI